MPTHRSIFIPRRPILGLAIGGLLTGMGEATRAARQALLHVSCDVSREFYRDDNALFGGWKKAQKDHFDDGGLCDQVLATAKK